MIFNDENKNISSSNKTYTIIEKNGEYNVCKLFGQYSNLEEAIEMQTKISLGMVSEEEASKNFFNEVHGK